MVKSALMLLAMIEIEYQFLVENDTKAVTGMEKLSPFSNVSTFRSVQFRYYYEHFSTFKVPICTLYGQINYIGVLNVQPQ